MNKFKTPMLPNSVTIVSEYGELRVGLGDLSEADAKKLAKTYAAALIEHAAKLREQAELWRRAQGRRR